MEQRSPHSASGGFSLIEIIVVLALIGFVYTVAMPQFSQRTGAETATKLSELAGDFRGAFDLSVLTGKTYRLVFMMGSGEYWLEEADRPDVYLGSDKADRDPTEAEEKDLQGDFDRRFDEYKDLAGTAIADEKGGKEIPPTSPVLAAKGALRPPVWTRVESLEWSKRSLGSSLLIRDLQAEHHGHKQDLGELGPEARGMIYIFPSGYIERSVLHIAYKKDDLVPDETQEGYTVVTTPYEGTAEVIPGTEEVDVHADQER